MELTICNKSVVMFTVAILENGGGVTAGDGQFRHIFHDHGTGLNNGAVAYGHRANDEHSIAEPHVVTDDDIFRNVCFVIRDASARVVIMNTGNDQAIGAAMEVVADGQAAMAIHGKAVEAGISAESGLTGQPGPAADEDLSAMCFHRSLRHILPV